MVVKLASENLINFSTAALRLCDSVKTFISDIETIAAVATVGRYTF